jgi:hypothetical protein
MIKIEAIAESLQCKQVVSEKEQEALIPAVVLWYQQSGTCVLLVL